MTYRHRVAVTGMGVVTPIGASVPAFAAALRTGVSGGGPITLFDPASLPTRIAAQVTEPFEALMASSGLADMLPPSDESEATVAAFRDRKVVFALAAAREAWAGAVACGTGPGWAAAAGAASATATHAAPASPARPASRAGPVRPAGPAAAGDESIGMQDSPRRLHHDAGLSLGIGLELFSMEDMVRLRTRGFVRPGSRVANLTFLQTPSDLAVPLLAYQYGLGAPPQVHVSACAAGTDALGSAFRAVATGTRRWMLAGGTDSMINPMGVAGFCKVSATTTANAEPTHASRPFDRRRDGFLLGEGAGMLVLERLDDARSRGATIHAEIAGYGNSFDAFGISEPHPEGRGALQAMARAIADAGLEPGAIDAINAHGTSTPKNDRTETLAIKRLLGERARHVPVSATKSMIGHLISAAGAVEAIAAIVGLREGWVHPTINLTQPDPECDLDYVPGEARRLELRYILSNSFAFGGQNAAIVLKASGNDAG